MPRDGPPSTTARKAALERGREAYQSQRYKHGVVFFSQVINSCPCSDITGDRTRAKCTCKNYDDGPRRGQAYGLVEEIVKPCTCEAPGRIFSRCDDPLHSQALDYRSGCYDALDKLEQARRDAEWALELYPLRLEAYLRFGKVARRQRDHVLAWQVYCAGVQVGRRNGLAEDDRFKKLLLVRQPLHTKFYKQDPIELPAEIVESIFLQFNTRQLSACLPVSKRWFRSLSGQPILWRILRFDPKARSIAGLNSVRRIVKYSGNDVRSLTITNTNRFNFETKFPALLMGSRKMTNLDLEGSPVNGGDGLSRATWTLSSLTNLTLKSHMFQKHGVPGPSDTNRLLKDILTRNVNHLQTVCITSDHVNFGPSWPRMENLKSLKIIETIKVTIARNTVGARHAQLVELPVLWEKVPKLEQLWLDVSHCVVRPRDADDPPPPSPWPTLRSLVVGPGVYWPFVGAPLNELRVLHRLGDVHQGPPEEIMTGFAPQDLPVQGAVGALSKLKHMYLPLFCGDSTNPSVGGIEFIRQGVEEAAASGSLRTLATKISVKTQDRDYLNSFDWLRGCKSLRSLSLFLGTEPFRIGLFGVPSGPSFSTSIKDLAALIASFPNLETLEVTHDDDEISTIGAIIEGVVQLGSSVKIIYQDRIIGAPYDNLRNYLKERSVELRCGRLPLPEFPVRWEEL